MRRFAVSARKRKQKEGNIILLDHFDTIDSMSEVQGDGFRTHQFIQPSLIDGKFGNGALWLSAKEETAKQYSNPSIIFISGNYSFDFWINQINEGIGYISIELYRYYTGRLLRLMIQRLYVGNNYYNYISVEREGEQSIPSLKLNLNSDWNHIAVDRVYKSGIPYLYLYVNGSLSFYLDDSKMDTLYPSVAFPIVYINHKYRIYGLDELCFFNKSRFNGASTIPIPTAPYEINS